MIEDLLRAQLEGLPVGLIYKDIRRIPLLIKAPDKIAHSEMDFLNLEIPLENGQSVTLRQLVKAQQVDGPVSVKRERHVREPAARRRAPECGGAHCPGHDFPDSFCHLQIGGRKPADHAQCAAGHDWRHHCPVADRGIPFCTGLGRLYRPAGYCGSQWRGHGQLFQPAAQSGFATGTGGERRGQAAEKNP